MRKRIASGCWNRGQRDLVGNGLAEREPQGDVDEVDAGRVADEIGHLAARDPRRHLDDRDRAVRVRDELREGDPVAQAEHLDGSGGDPLRELELVAVGRRGIDVDPADAEADPRRPQPIGQRHDLGRAAARDHDPVHLRALDEPLEDALLLGGLGERRVEVAVEVVLRSRSGRRRAGRPSRPASAPPGTPTVSSARLPSTSERTAANGGCGTPSSANARRITILLRIRCATAVPIVGSPRRSVTAATTGTARSAETVSAPSTRVAPRDLGHGVDVGEVDGLADVGDLEPGRVGVAVDGDDADALLARLQDRATLVAPGADEEDGLHSGAMLDDVTARPAAEAGTPRVASGRSHSRSSG